MEEGKRLAGGKRDKRRGRMDGRMKDVKMGSFVSLETYFLGHLYDCILLFWGLFGL